MNSDVRALRIALAQTNPTVGALAENASDIVAAAVRARDEGARLVVYPELALVGYPPKDWLDRPSFVRAQRDTLGALVRDLPAGPTYLVGFVDEIDVAYGPRLRNAVAAIRDGAIRTIVHKRLLPNYDVFDELRWFAPGDASDPIDVDGVRVGITICEDAWSDVPSPLATRTYDVDPIADVVARGADLIVNIAASPFDRRKREGRVAILRAAARKHARPLVFVNQVGGHDDLVFDGSSTYFDADGTSHTDLASFAEDFAVTSLATQPIRRERPATDEAAVLDALTLGVRDYVGRSGVSGAVVGVSGGLDSALVAAIAARARGPSRVGGRARPTRYSSQHSLDDAAALAAKLGIRFEKISIDTMFQTGLDALAPLLDSLAPAPKGDLTFENLQARIRCQTLMAVANRLSAMVLNTGNKSEIACGYCTLYGDMAGGLSVIGDVFKTFAYDVARELNRQAGDFIIPESTLTKPPSAELRPDQKDSDSLPEYDVLDPVLEAVVDLAMGRDELLQAGFDAALVDRVLRLVRISEHKRRQLPPALIVSGKAFAVGRRHPIAQGYPG